MREKLNENPLMQAAVIGVLLIGAGFFLLSSMGGGEEEAGSGGATAAPSVAPSGPAPSGEVLTASGGTAADAPPPPKPVLSAWNAHRTVVLLFVHDGGIDDRLVAGATRRLAGMPGVSTFVVSARRIYRYASITEGVGVQRVPALVVVRPKRAGQSIPTASVQYGFQSPESIVQAVVDAGYRGPTVQYHP